MKKISILLLAMIAVWSCQREADVRTSFPFAVVTDYQADATVNTPNKVSFDLTPEQVVTTNVYRATYRVLSGDGFFKLPNGDEFLEEQVIVLDGLGLDAFFYPKSIGEIKIELTFKDQEGATDTVYLYFIREDNPFEIEMNTVRNNVTVNETVGFTIALFNLGRDPTVAYSIKCFISQGKGDLSKVTQTGLEPVELGETNAFVEGTTNYETTFTEEGINTITIEVEDSNGQKISKSMDFTVDVIDFTLEATPERNETSLRSGVKVNFLISEVSGGDDSYTLRYVIESGNADIFDDDTQIFAGTNTEVPLGVEFSWILSPTDTEDVVIRFIAKNNSGVEKKQTVSLKVKTRDFDFTATRSLASVSIDQPVDINYKITEQEGASMDSYTMIFDSNSNGTLTVNDVVYNAGEIIAIPGLDFTGVYTPLLNGEHVVTSSITAASNNNTKSQQVSIEVEPSDFEFTVTSDSEVAVQKTIDLSFNINELAGDSTFDMKYDVTGPNNEISNADGVVLTPGTNYDVENTFVWRLKGQNSGKMTITFTATNQYGVSKSKTISIDVKKIEFDFNINVVGADFFLGTPIPFSFEMSAPNSLTYELAFNANTGGSIESNDGLVISENQFADVTHEDFMVSYSPSISGNTVINFTIRGSNGFTVTKAVNFQINEKAKITKARYVEEGSCNFYEKDLFTLEFTKKPGTTIVSVTYTVRGIGSGVHVFVPAISGSSSAGQPVEYSCKDGEKGDVIEVTITDSRGQVSDMFVGRLD